VVSVCDSSLPLAVGWIKGSLEARAKARATKFSTTELLDLHSDQTQDVGFVLTRQ